jgi:hypothetical protein
MIVIEVKGSIYICKVFLIFKESVFYFPLHPSLQLTQINLRRISIKKNINWILLLFFRFFFIDTILWKIL